MDPLPLARALLRCKSVTPADDGAQAVLAGALETAGFAVTRLRFGEIENLYAERGGAGPHLCFAGHTDVVPAGTGDWKHGAFAGEVVADPLAGDVLVGRGAVDMKGAVAAFAAAAAAPCGGRVSLLITGDEEGDAVDGTAKVLDWMAAAGKKPDFCVVGEPTCQAVLGDTVKIGRRGSLNARITVTGRQGHAAYPQAADNPVHRLVAALAVLTGQALDAGTAWFEPSNLQVTSVDVGNTARNVIPGAATAWVNVRFNDLHDEPSLTAWLNEVVAAVAPSASVEVFCSGGAFLTSQRPGSGLTPERGPGPGPGLEPGTAALAAAVTAVTGVTPAMSTGGGTSDARFISKFCPVAEFGLVGAGMHQLDEAVPVRDLQALAAVYRALIDGFCG